MYTLSNLPIQIAFLLARALKHALGNKNILLPCKKATQIISCRRNSSRVTVYMVLACMGGMILSQLGGIQPGSEESLFGSMLPEESLAIP